MVRTAPATILEKRSARICTRAVATARRRVGAFTGGSGGGGASETLRLVVMVGVKISSYARASTSGSVRRRMST